jgi:hypothetical protein
VAAAAAAAAAAAGGGGSSSRGSSSSRSWVKQRLAAAAEATAAAAAIGSTNSCFVELQPALCIALVLLAHTAEAQYCSAPQAPVLLAHTAEAQYRSEVALQQMQKYSRMYCAATGSTFYHLDQYRRIHD